MFKFLAFVDLLIVGGCVISLVWIICECSGRFDSKGEKR